MKDNWYEAQPLTSCHSQFKTDTHLNASSTTTHFTYNIKTENAPNQYVSLETKSSKRFQPMCDWQ